MKTIPAGWGFWVGVEKRHDNLANGWWRNPAMHYGKSDWRGQSPLNTLKRCTWMRRKMKQKSVVLGLWEFRCVTQISKAVVTWAVPHKWREGYWWSSLTTGSTHEWFHTESNLVSGLSLWRKTGIGIMHS